MGVYSHFGVGLPHSSSAMRSVGYGVSLSEAQPGDILQLQTTGTGFHHAPVIVEIRGNPAPETILVAAHSEDCDMRPLSTYPYRKVRLIHILGARGTGKEA